MGFLVRSSLGNVILLSNYMPNIAIPIVIVPKRDKRLLTGRKGSVLPVIDGDVVVQSGGTIDIPDEGKHLVTLRDLINSTNTLKGYIANRRKAKNSLVNGEALIARIKTAAGPSFASALNGGIALADTAGELGQSFGPKGIAIATAVGFLAGITLGLIPFERLDALGKWRNICSDMSPVDKFGVMVGSMRFVEKALRMESANPAPREWRWGTNPPLGHTAWGGPIANTVFTFEILFESGMIVPSFGHGDGTLSARLFALWVVAFVGGFHDNDNKVEDMRHSWPLLRDGVISQDIIPILGSYIGQQKLGDIRAELSRHKVSLWNPALPQSIAKVISV